LVETFVDEKVKKFGEPEYRVIIFPLQASRNEPANIVRAERSYRVKKAREEYLSLAWRYLISP
jgi:hypothetical protein